MLNITVLGCGTSTGVPTIGCDCDICRSTDPRNSRTRASVYVAKGETRLLVDCGPDFRHQALREGVRRVDGLFITHTHADHIYGIDDLRMINWAQGAPIKVFATEESIEDLSRIFRYCFERPKQGGGVPALEWVVLERRKTFEFNGVQVTPIPALHGNLEVMGFRFDNFVYITDCSEIPEDSRPLLEGVDSLVLSGLRHRPHGTHFDLDQAIEEARRHSPRRTYFVHMTHDLDYEATNRELPEGFELLYDGLEMEVD
jgi:phosphoribosyl 1,2-cyclic phosphate phosphodiesterase